MSSYDRLAYRVKNLPLQLEKTRMRYEYLKREARELGLKDLVKEHP